MVKWTCAADATDLQCVFSCYVDSLVHLHSVLKMPARGKSVLNCDWVLDGACKYWLQVELRNAVKNGSSEFCREQSRQQEEKRTRKNMKQTGLSLTTFPL